MEQTPALISLINCNSPLRWDDRMLDSLFEYAAANQAVVLTPFILMGAMSPVTIPAALVQQIAEALTGIALAAADPARAARWCSARSCPTSTCSPARRPSAPRSPASACSAPARSRATSGCRSAPAARSTSSQVPDAQAGYEALMTLMPTFLAGANWVMHSAGWLEGGLVAGYEKFIVDIELLQMMQPSSRRWRSTRSRWPSARTRRSAPVATSSARRTRWSGSAPASTARCSPRRRTTSAGCATVATTPPPGPRRSTRTSSTAYEQPPLDEAIRAEMEEFVVRRRKELGD